ncbi:CoA-binding protein [Fulvivirgaceae bacterium BMA12]|uniref:CoA-binding protein n=1 Tax=Agaribacillus aureus TaxID=3051825 RepID=A0ABT8L2X6_9BACT|nr:CoA-binding protein [Fulvivirgaceae bacterium BMA12]
MKKTMVLGATPNPARYAYLAAQMLVENKIEIVPVGIKSGTVAGEKILDLKTQPLIADIHTITLYIGPGNQPQWYDYILTINPQRVIFNPGTENPVLESMVSDQGVEVLKACTLVMLSVGNY